MRLHKMKAGLIALIFFLCLIGINVITCATSDIEKVYADDIYLDNNKKDVEKEHIYSIYPDRNKKDVQKEKGKI